MSDDVPKSGEPVRDKTAKSEQEETEKLKSENNDLTAQLRVLAGALTELKSKHERLLSEKGDLDNKYSRALGEKDVLGRDLEGKNVDLNNYENALASIAEGKSLANIYAESYLKTKKPKGFIQRKLDSLGKNLPGITALAVALSAVYFGVIQSDQKAYELRLTKELKETELKLTEMQKKTELEITKAKSLGDLVDKLSSENQSVRKFAVFAAIGLGMDDFNKQFIDSVSDSDTSDANIETLKLLFEKIESGYLKIRIRKKLSRLFTIKAESSAKSSQENAGNFARQAIEYFSNALAEYRLGEIEKERNLETGLAHFEAALTALKNPDADFIIDQRPDLKISIYQRMGEVLAAQGKFPEAKQNFEDAKIWLNKFPTKDKQDLVRLERLDKCIALSSEYKSCGQD
jgi:hypothetical protein